MYVQIDDVNVRPRVSALSAFRIKVRLDML
jgi:hypothetical protein